MRIIGEIPHTDCKITLYHWNNRYLIKVEKDFMEQTFKINQYDLSSEGDLSKVIDETFIHDAMVRFSSMEQSLEKSLQKL